MIPTDEDTFLPTGNDRIKAEIKRLQARLSAATEKHRTLKRQLIEEDLSYVVVSKITEEIKDPTRTKAHELEGLQKEVFEQLLIAAEQCTLREIVSYHRLGGRTVFDYNKHYFGIRIETFYEKSYRDSFYLLFLKKRPNRVDKHTIPKFIPLNVLQDKFLPHDMPTFLRVIQDCVQAYVARREMMKALERLSEDRNLKILHKNDSLTKIALEGKSFTMGNLHIAIHFSDYTSRFPTDVVIRDTRHGSSEEEINQLTTNMMNGDIVGTITPLFSL
ncbi:hypothetical protein MFLAVUS_008085 [Mucor flavus]|uniref:Uncharacterized protein n=1 Tax=Mucor flavus TaxID=439312 RepID=A0ABP9Z632_9FUNG